MANSASSANRKHIVFMLPLSILRDVGVDVCRIVVATAAVDFLGVHYFQVAVVVQHPSAPILTIGKSHEVRPPFIRHGRTPHIRCGNSLRPLPRAFKQRTSVVHARVVIPKQEEHVRREQQRSFVIAGVERVVETPREPAVGSRVVTDIRSRVIRLQHMRVNLAVEVRPTV